MTEGLRQRQRAHLCLRRVLESQAIMLLAIGSISEHRRCSKAQGLTTAQYFNLHRLAFGLLQPFNHHLDRWNWLAIHGDDLAAFFQTSFGAGHVGFEVADNYRFVRKPPS